MTFPVVTHVFSHHVHNRFWLVWSYNNNVTTTTVVVVVVVVVKIAGPEWIMDDIA
jgi:hypothetical protein